MRILLRDRCDVLSTHDVWRPIAAGRFPVLLQVSYYVTPTGDRRHDGARGYVCVLANSRGRGGSEGNGTRM